MLPETEQSQVRNTEVMKFVVNKGFVLAAALAASAQIASPTQAERKLDARAERLKAYLEAKQCPISGLAGDFVAAADRHDLDWRLLPSISMVESTGGKYQRNNNIFGWDNGNRRFASVRHGIHSVARQLGQGRHYRHKSLDRVLRTYNPNPAYAERVKAVMKQLNPTSDFLN